MRCWVFDPMNYETLRWHRNLHSPTNADVLAQLRPNREA